MHIHDLRPIPTPDGPIVNRSVRLGATGTYMRYPFDDSPRACIVVHDGMGSGVVDVNVFLLEGDQPAGWAGWMVGDGIVQARAVSAYAAGQDAKIRGPFAVIGP